MPYDPIGFEDLKVPTVVPFDFDTASPDERLLELARLLEDEQAWRDKIMEWDYCTLEASSEKCETAGCALGLANIIWQQFRKYGEEKGAVDYASLHFFDIDEGTLNVLFYGMFTDAPMAKIMPRMVATAIRQFVSNRQTGTSS